ncbi:MAG: glycerol-3-phosphate 1-O-acyltransferase PlsY [Erysipelotrichia bacterium]|jgi:glycerol-3-phosphate acyltransferase PlsY|nr:glycerol-3-phosphate 1-O-acyltransferase PlsY [Erysipelotrichia bacterium]
MNFFIAALVGYVFGSVPFALVIGKLFYNTDVREHGSKNLGASNAGRVLGKKAAFSIAFLDTSKAAIAVWIAFLLFGQEVAIVAGIATSLGHCFPLFAKFKGGKAVSTAAGYLLALSFLSQTNGWIIGLIPVFVFFGLLKLFKMVSLASISAVTTATILLFLLQTNLMISISFSIVAVIVIVRHHENIGRIMAGTERKIKWMG